MDPTTTLITFLLQTDPSVTSVQLIGSWDNFTTWYTMKRDVRRGRGEWRGCYSFNNIRDSHTGTQNSTRNGGLRMGQTYYYYYEVNGSTETYDPVRPSTSACPYLPGQTVNTLVVPVQQTFHNRTSSLNSLREESFMTMNPESRYITPKPVASAIRPPNLRRLGSASSLLLNRSSSRSDRSELVGPSWKRLFARKQPSREFEAHFLPKDEVDDVIVTVPPTPCTFPPVSRPQTASDGRRTRDLSPESLRRFLVEDIPSRPVTAMERLAPLKTTDDVIDEIDDDDDNFATSAVSETPVYGTRLSPPPFQRSASSDTVPQTLANSSSLTLTIPSPPTRQYLPANGAMDDAESHISDVDVRESGQGHMSACVSCTDGASPTSPLSMADESTSFYDSNDDDDVLSSNDGDHFEFSSSPNMAHDDGSFNGYSLPRDSQDGGKCLDGSDIRMPTQFLSGRDARDSIGATNFLGGTIDTGLDDFANELGLIVNVIANKQG